MHEGEDDICYSDDRFVIRFEHVHTVEKLSYYMPGYRSKRWVGEAGVRLIARMATNRYGLDPAAVEVMLADLGC